MYEYFLRLLFYFFKFMLNLVSSFSLNIKHFISDSTCVIWDRSCGAKGNCWVYDKTSFRHKVNFTASGRKLI